MLESKTILVTGASSGFGKLIVSALLERGHRLIAALRGGEDRLSRLYRPEELSSGRLVGVEIHMERPETFSPIRELIERRFEGRLDVLINNAAYALLAPAEDQNEQTIRHQMEVNFLGTVLLTNGLLPCLRASRRGGRILNFTTSATYLSPPFYALYSASKCAIEGYSEGLAKELSPFGIQVGLVVPGAFDTNFVSTAARSTDSVPEGSPYAEQSRQLNRFLNERASRYCADPRLLARRVVRLCVRRRLPPRTLVGKDAWAIALLRWLLPLGWLSRLVNWGFRKLALR